MRNNFDCAKTWPVVHVGIDDHAKGQTTMARKSDEPVAHTRDPAPLRGNLKIVGGSTSDDWNNDLVNQVINSLSPRSDPEQVSRQRRATLHALMGIAPNDEIEGMLAAQLIACHHASMECYGRAMLPQQPFEGRRENLSQANKLSRTYATLLEALNRHRGKGQQRVTVEHVHVHEGGQAIVGNVASPGGGAAQKSEEQPHAKQIAHAPQPPVWSAVKERERVPVTGDAERPLPDARRPISGRAKG